ncbi:MAG: umuD1 [Rickettsiaceae bacterium]|jgi:DNA polymerase V|nr:umuD1 [Rickettsiaceae bacterium]
MGQGGKRVGAGRPKGKGLYGTTTTTMRVPANMVDDVRKYAISKGNKVQLYTCKIEVGNQDIRTDDLLKETIDLQSYLIKNPETTFCVKVSGESMIEDGICEGDILIADSSLEVKEGQMVIAAIDGKLTVKRMVYRNQSFLLPENSMFQAIPINENIAVQVFGVITSLVRAV